MSGLFTSGASKLGEVSADPTGSPILVEHGVSLRVLVAVFALGFLTVSLASFSAPDIFSTCHRLHMLRVNARSHAAQMIQLEAGRYRAYQLFISGSMSTGRSSISIDNPRVTRGVQRSEPEPATAIRFGQNPCQEVLKSRRLRSRHSRHYSAEAEEC